LQPSSLILMAITSRRCFMAPQPTCPFRRKKSYPICDFSDRWQAISALAGWDPAGVELMFSTQAKLTTTRHPMTFIPYYRPFDTTLTKISARRGTDRGGES
jgi:hypothetical protein